MGRVIFIGRHREWILREQWQLIVPPRYLLRDIGISMPVRPCLQIRRLTRRLKVLHLTCSWLEVVDYVVGEVVVNVNEVYLVEGVELLMMTGLVAFVAGVVHVLVEEIARLVVLGIRRPFLLCRS